MQQQRANQVIASLHVHLTQLQYDNVHCTFILSWKSVMCNGGGGGDDCDGAQWQFLFVVSFHLNLIVWYQMNASLCAECKPWITNIENYKTCHCADGNDALGVDLATNSGSNLAIAWTANLQIPFRLFANCLELALNVYSTVYRLYSVHGVQTLYLTLYGTLGTLYVSILYDFVLNDFKCHTKFRKYEREQRCAHI